MDLSHFETRLRFPETHRVASPALSVFRVLSGQQCPKEGRPREAGVRIRDEQNHRLVSWDYTSCAVVFEDKRDLRACVYDTVRLLDKIHGVAPISGVSSVQLRMDWILPVTGKDFGSLEQQYRECFIKQHSIFEKSSDSSVVIDMKYGQRTLHHQSGPMEIAQLQSDYRVFPVKTLKSKLFVFLNNLVDSTEISEYSGKRMEAFLDDAVKLCENHAALFQSVMEEVL